MTYVDGFLIPVPKDGRENYRAVAQKAAPIFLKHGATRVVECWHDDVPDGKVTDFKMSVKAEADERVVFSWIEWPSREARDAGNEKVMAEMHEVFGDSEPPFDGKRMIFGGFVPIVDERG